MNSWKIQNAEECTIWLVMTIHKLNKIKASQEEDSAFQEEALTLKI